MFQPVWCPLSPLQPVCVCGSHHHHFAFIALIPPPRSPFSLSLCMCSLLRMRSGGRGTHLTHCVCLLCYFTLPIRNLFLASSYPPSPILISPCAKLTLSIHSHALSTTLSLPIFRWIPEIIGIILSCSPLPLLDYRLLRRFFVFTDFIIFLACSNFPISSLFPLFLSPSSFRPIDTLAIIISLLLLLLFD